MSRLFQFLLTLGPDRFFGEVRLRFRDGQLALVTVERDYKAEDLPRPSQFSRQAYAAQVAALVKDAGQ